MLHSSKSFLHVARQVANVTAQLENSAISASTAKLTSLGSSQLTGAEALQVTISQMPFAVRWSDSLEIEQLVANIPLISVGLLGVGAATVWMGLARANRALFYLFAGSIAALFSGIIDMSNILASQTANYLKSNSLNITSSIFLASMVVFRLFYVFERASMPSRLERSQAMKMRMQNPAECRLSRLSLSFTGRKNPRTSSVVYFHSSSWERFGIVGIILKYSLLTLVAGIGVLEGLWRIGFLTDVFQFAIINRISHGLQIGYLAIFQVKTIEASFKVEHRWFAFQETLPMLFGNTVGIAAAVPNFPILGFSETPVGRFLTVLHFYVYVTDLALHHRKGSERQSDSFIGSFPPLLEKVNSGKTDDVASILSHVPDAVPINNPTTDLTDVRIPPPKPGLPSLSRQLSLESVSSEAPRGISPVGPVIRRSSVAPSWLGEARTRGYSLDQATSRVDTMQVLIEDVLEERGTFASSSRPFSGPVAPSPISLTGTVDIGSRPNEGSIILKGPPSLYSNLFHDRQASSSSVTREGENQRQISMYVDETIPRPSPKGNSYDLPSRALNQISPPPMYVSRTPSSAKGPPIHPPPTAQLPEIPLAGTSRVLAGFFSLDEKIKERFSSDSTEPPEGDTMDPSTSSSDPSSRTSGPSVQSRVSIPSMASMASTADFSLSNFPAPPLTPSMFDSDDIKGGEESDTSSMEAAPPTSTPMAKGSTSLIVEDETFLFEDMPTIPKPKPVTSMAKISRTVTFAEPIEIVRKLSKGSERSAILPEGSTTTDESSLLTPTEIRKATKVDSSSPVNRTTPRPPVIGLPSNPRPPRRMGSKDSQLSQETVRGSSTMPSNVMAAVIEAPTPSSNTKIEANFSYDPNRAFERPRPPPLQLLKEISNNREVEVPVIVNSVLTQKKSYRSKPVGKDQIYVVRRPQGPRDEKMT